MINILDTLDNESFNIFEDLGVKIYYKKDHFFEGKEKYKLEKNQTSDKIIYDLFISENISKVELIELMFSLENKLGFKKYNLLNELKNDIKERFNYLLEENNSKKRQRIIKFFKEKGLSDYTINEIISFDQNLQKIEDVNNLGINNEINIAFLNFIFHIGIEYMKNETKVFTSSNLKKLLRKYNVDFGESFASRVPRKNNPKNTNKKEILITVKDPKFLPEEDSKIIDYIKFEGIKSKVEELNKNNRLTAQNIESIIQALNKFIYQIPSIYTNSNDKNESNNLIQNINEKKFMCLLKNMFLYGLFSEIPIFEFNSNLEPHHSTSTVNIKNNEDKKNTYYLEPSAYEYPLKLEETGNNIGIFPEFKVFTLKGQFLELSKVISGPAKYILYSSYLSNKMYTLLDKKDKDFFNKDFKTIQLLYKLSSFSNPKAYMPHRNLGLAYDNLYEIEIKKGNRKKAEKMKKLAFKKYIKTLKIFPLDTPAWDHIGKHMYKKDKLRLITILVRLYNMGTFKKSLDKINYKKYNVSEEEFKKLTDIFYNKEFNKLLEYLPSIK